MGKYKVVIIGTVWYGLHSYLFLKNNYYDKVEICLLERNHNIFQGCSTYNQNRLHVGFHYPRSLFTKSIAW
jgi:NADH dehydrogenase FAD-containing subunit